MLARLVQLGIYTIRQITLYHLIQSQRKRSSAVLQYRRNSVTLSAIPLQEKIIEKVVTVFPLDLIQDGNKEN